MRYWGFELLIMNNHCRKWSSWCHKVTRDCTSPLYFLFLGMRPPPPPPPSGMRPWGGYPPGPGYGGDPSMNGFNANVNPWGAMPRPPPPPMAQ